MNKLHIEDQTIKGCSDPCDKKSEYACEIEIFNNSGQQEMMGNINKVNAFKKMSYIFTKTLGNSIKKTLLVHKCF